MWRVLFCSTAWRARSHYHNGLLPDIVASTTPNILSNKTQTLWVVLSHNVTCLASNNRVR
jgi:hypothetical protein